MKLLYFLSASCLIFIFNSISAYPQNWQLVWSDEFDSTSINLSNWTHETGGNGWGNNELQFYTNRDVNSYIDSGKLVIKAIAENYSGRSYTSARLKTQEKRFWKYGKVESRLKLPFGQGIWPAFWMLGETISLVGWPACGEIDIVEMIGGSGRENTVYGTAHWDNSGQHAQYGNDYTLSAGTFSDDFHVFRIEWDQSLIKWYVDNSLYNTISITPSGLSEFHQEFFIILNLAVGGNWPGNPNSSTTFPQYLEVDYIRVYQMTATGIEDEASHPIGFNLEQNYVLSRPQIP
jgi:beta-glucanase (GH16 family)